MSFFWISSAGKKQTGVQIHAMTTARDCVTTQVGKLSLGNQCLLNFATEAEDLRVYEYSLATRICGSSLWCR